MYNIDNIPPATFIQIGDKQMVDMTPLQIESPPDIDYSEMQLPSLPDEFIQEYKNNKDDTKHIESKPKDIQPIKYHIVDLFWLINPNFSNNTIRDNEVHFVTISLNIDFGNLRIGFFNIPNGAILNATLFHQKLQRIIAGTIYPSACWKIAKELNNDETIQFTCMEQLINYTGEQWQKERPIVFIQKNKTAIRVNISDVSTNKTYFYDFEQDQLDMLTHACRFTINDGFKLVGENVLKR